MKTQRAVGANADVWSGLEPRAGTWLPQPEAPIKPLPLAPNEAALLSRLGGSSGAGAEGSRLQEELPRPEIKAALLSRGRPDATVGLRTASVSAPSSNGCGNKHKTPSGV